MSDALPSRAAGGGFGSSDPGWAECKSGLILRLASAVSRTYPDAKGEVGERGFTVFGLGDDGFPISVEDMGDARVLYVGPGMVEFDDDESLLDCVLQVCSSECRLLVDKVGGAVREWKLVVQTGSQPERTLLGGGSGSSFFSRKTSRTVHWNDRGAPAPPALS